MEIFAIIMVAVIYFFVITIINPISRENFWLKNKKLKENQMLWDKYSKNMTREEKISCYMDWCIQRKFESENHFYWFPRI